MYDKITLQNIFITTMLEDWNTSYQETKHQIDLNLQGVSYTEKAAYFIGRFIDELRYAVYQAEDAVDQSELLVAAKDMVFGAVTALGGRFLLGDSKSGIVFQGINAIFTLGLSRKHCSDLSQAKAKAQKIINFLAEENHDKTVKSKYIPSKQINRLAIRFWREFRLHIELLSKGKGGSDVLIDYLTEQIIDSLMDAPEHMVRDSFEDTLKYLRHTIFLGKSTIFSREKIPNTKLATDNVELSWNLQEMLLHSPRVVCSALTQADSSEPMLEFQTYSCTMTKTRYFKTVDADDSHKYPSVFLMNSEDIAQLSSFQKTAKETILRLPRESVRNITNFYVNEKLYLNLYFYARNVKRLEKDTNPCRYYIELMTFFELNARNILNRSENLRKYSWLLTVVEMINIVNLFDKYIERMIKKNNYLAERFKQDSSFKALYESCEKIANALRAYFCINQEIYQYKVDAIAEKMHFFQKIEKLSVINASEFNAMSEAIPYKTKPITPIILPIYTTDKDNNGEMRFNICRIRENDQLMLSANYVYKNLKGETIGPLPIMSDEYCKNYNEYLNNYFMHFEKDELLEAYFALGNAIWFFSMGINDEMIFIQDDYGLVNRVCEICKALTAEHELIDEEITAVGGFKRLKGYSEAADHLSRYKQITIFFRTALKETTRLYQTSTNIRENKTLLEKFSNSPWQYKVGAILSAGVVMSGMIYFGSSAIRALSKTNNNQSTSDKSPDRPIGVLTSGVIGIVCAGVIVVSADQYAAALKNKRIIREMIDPNSTLQRKLLNPSELHRTTLLDEKENNNNSIILKPSVSTEKEIVQQEIEPSDSVPSFNCTIF